MSSLSINTAQYGLSSSALTASSIGELQDLQGTQASAQGIDGDGDGIQGTGPASSTRISKQGQLFSQLQKLQTEDPAKFKQVLTDAASKLSAVAQSATGDDQKFLSNLAAKFTKAAGGDLSALQPPQRTPSNPVEAAYQQGAQTTLNGQSLDPLAQATSSTPDAQNGQAQSADPSASGAKHHHHHGGHSKLSAGTQQTLDSVFQSIKSALGTTSTSTDATAATAVAA